MMLLAPFMLTRLILQASNYCSRRCHWNNLFREHQENNSRSFWPRWNCERGVTTMNNHDTATALHAAGTSSPKKRDADYVFYELTRSICPECRRVIDAQIILRDNKVYMRKRCSQCGPFEALVLRRRGSLHDIRQIQQAGTIPLAHGSEIHGRLSPRLRSLS